MDTTYEWTVVNGTWNDNSIRIAINDKLMLCDTNWKRVSVPLLSFTISMTAVNITQENEWDWCNERGRDRQSLKQVQYICGAHSRLRLTQFGCAFLLHSLVELMTRSGTQRFPMYIERLHVHVQSLGLFIGWYTLLWIDGGAHYVYYKISIYYLLSVHGYFR